MSDQSRLRDAPETEPVGQLLSDGVEGLDQAWPASERADVTLALEARLDREQAAKPRLRWVAIPVAAVAAVCVFWLVHEPGSRSLDVRVVSLGAEATLEVSSEGEVDVPPAATDARHVVLKSGRVCAEVAHRDLSRQGPLIVDAPHLKVIVVGTRFCVTSSGGVSTVSVTEGRIRAESPSGATVSVDAGESLRSDDARLSIPPPPAVPVLAPTLVPAAAPLPTLPATPGCSGAQSVSARRDCYTRVARGADMGAQNALYGLGLLERDEEHDGAAALTAWRTYEARFPAGVFAPEASLGVLGELLTERRYPEALQETDRYLAVAEESGRSRVELVRAQLLLGPIAKPDEALPLLRGLAGTKELALREETLFALGSCLAALGKQDEAAETFRQSLAEYPAGAHAGELRPLVR